MEINDKCVGCGNCHAVCPMAAARAAVVFFMITGTSVLGAESMYSDGRPEAVKRALQMQQHWPDIGSDRIIR